MCKLSVGSIVEVHGFVMLAGLDPGKYRVKKIDTFYGIKTYNFCKPLGSKVLARHAVGSVDPWVRDKDSEDLNKVVECNPLASMKVG